MSRSSRANQQNNSGSAQDMQQQQQSPRNSGGGGGIPYGTSLTFVKKGVTISGPAIQTVTVPISRQQQQPQKQGTQQFNQQGQGQGSINSILSACLLAAQTQDTINAQQLALFQKSQGANTQLLNSLSKIATQMGMAMQTPTRKQRQGYTAPQDIHARQQARGQQKQGQRQKVYAGS